VCSKPIGKSYGDKGKKKGSGVGTFAGDLESAVTGGSLKITNEGGPSWKNKTR